MPRSMRRIRYVAQTRLMMKGITIKLIIPIPMAANQPPSIPYRMYAPTPKATTKEKLSMILLKYIGILRFAR